MHTEIFVEFYRNSIQKAQTDFIDKSLKHLRLKLKTNSHLSEIERKTTKDIKTLSYLNLRLLSSQFLRLNFIIQNMKPEYIMSINL